MKFSVLMSIYYKENPSWLIESIESVLNNSIRPTEIVIVKDGILTDELENVLDDFLTKYPEIFHVCGYEKNKGLGLALQYGVNECKYDLIARMDTDDICARDRFEKELKVMEDNSITMVGSNTIEFTDNISNVISSRVMPEKHEDIVSYSKTRNPFIHPSMMLRREAVLSAGNYQPCHLCEDYDMWVRMLENGAKAYNIQENLVFMRVSKDFYRRRGGWKYFKSITNFKRKLYKTGYMSYGKYLKTYWASAIVSLMPGVIREFVYKKMLRK